MTRIALNSLRGGARIGILALLILQFNFADAQFEQLPGLHGGYVQAVAKVGENIFAGALGGVFRSDDDGATWEPVNDGLSNVNVNSLLAVGSRLYVSTNGGGSYFSDNEGTTWTKITVASDRTFTNLSTTANEVYALGNNYDLFRIDNDQATVIITDLANVRAMTATSTKIFIATVDGLYESADEGESWTALESWGANGGVYNLSSTGNIVLALPLNGLAKISYDNGDSWTETYSNPLAPSTVAIVGDHVYIGSSAAALNTLSGSVDPFFPVSGLPAMSGMTSNSAAIFAGSQDGIYRSVDGGETWSLSNSGMTSAPIFDLATVGTTVYATAGRKVMSYNGTTWTDLAAPSSYGFPFLTIYASETMIVAGTYSTGVLVSTDDGENWQEATGIIGATSLVEMGGKVYGGNYQGVFESTDGIAWTKVLDKQYVNAMGAAGSDLYVSNFEGMTRWTAAGIAEVNAGLPAGSYAASFAGISDQVFCGLTNYGLYTSTNRGATWTKLPLDGTVESLTYDSGSLYCTQLETGIKVSEDKGLTWTAYNDGLPVTMYNGFNGISELAFGGSQLYAGGIAAGVWKNCAIGAKPEITATGLTTTTPLLTSSSASGNQWYLNGNAISGNTGQTMTPVDGGTYTVVVTQDGCASPPSLGFDVIVLGADDVRSEFTVFAYPNPAKGSARIGVRGLAFSDRADIIMYDINGRQVVSGSVTGDEALSTAGAAPGTYIIRAVFDQKVERARLVIH